MAGAAAAAAAVAELALRVVVRAAASAAVRQVPDGVEGEPGLAAWLPTTTGGPPPWRVLSVSAYARHGLAGAVTVAL